MKKFGAWVALYLVAAFVFTPAKAYVGASWELMKLSAEELSAKSSENLFGEVISTCGQSRTKEDCRQTGLVDLCRWNEETENCRIDLVTLSQQHRHSLGMIVDMTAIVLGAEVFFTSFHVKRLAGVAMWGIGLLVTGYGVLSSWKQWGISAALDRALKKEELLLQRNKLFVPNKRANGEYVLVIEEMPTDLHEQEKSFERVESMLHGFERTQNPKSLLWLQAKDLRSLQDKIARIAPDVNITHIVIRSKELVDFKLNGQGFQTKFVLEPLRKQLAGGKVKVFLEIDSEAWNGSTKNYQFARAITQNVRDAFGSKAIVYVPESARFCTGFTKSVMSPLAFAVGMAPATIFTKRLEAHIAAGLAGTALLWALLPQCGYAIDGDRYSEFIGDYALMLPPNHWFSDDSD